MENKPSNLTFSLGYAAIIGLGLIVFSLIIYLVDANKQSAWNYLSYLILLAGLVWTQINYRDKYFGGFIEYGKVFMIGMLTSLFISIIVALYTFVFFKYIDPGAMEEAVSIAEKKMMDKGLSDQEIEQGLAMMQKFQSVGMYTFFALIGNFIFGVIFSLITSIFIKKENQGFDQPQA